MRTETVGRTQTRAARACLAMALAATGLGILAQPLSAQAHMGGHVGVVIPMVTHAGGNTVADVVDGFAIGMPMGVTFKGSGRMAFDLEMVPVIHTAHPRENSLTIHPGLVWGLGHNFAAGMRVAFDVNSATWGFTPLINHAWPIKSEKSFFKAYFVEAVMPIRFNRPVIGPKTDAVGFAMHFGVGF